MHRHQARSVHSGVFLEAWTQGNKEFILLSDTLGVSTLVDSINNAKPPGATEGTVLGPFFTEDAPDRTFQIYLQLITLTPTLVLVDKGASIASEGKGDYMFVEGIVQDVQGKPIPNAIIDTWETDGHGQYDTQVGRVPISPPQKHH